MTKQLPLLRDFRFL